MYCQLIEKEVDVIEKLKMKNSKSVTISRGCTGRTDRCETTKNEKCLFNNKR